MNTTLLAQIHLISVMLFLLNYLIKTVLLFSNTTLLDKYSTIARVPDMIFSVAFLVTGLLLYYNLGGIKVFHIIKLALILLAIPIGIVGFKKRKRFVALLSLIMIIGAYGFAEMSRNKPFIPARVVVSGDDGSLKVLGNKTYLANCVFCHGTDGKKGYRNAPDLTHTTLDAGLVQQMVREGSKGKMPSYKNVLSGDEIAAVSEYVETLRQQ
ncbi:MAG: cytochrome c [Bacteroidia bacterium]|nr:cytochrome c [Bacteroidia bacterium]